MSHSVTKVPYEAFELVNAKPPPVKNIRDCEEIMHGGDFLFSELVV